MNQLELERLLQKQCNDMRGTIEQCFDIVRLHGEPLKALKAHIQNRFIQSHLKATSAFSDDGSVRYLAEEGIDFFADYDDDRIDRLQVGVGTGKDVHNVLSMLLVEKGNPVPQCTVHRRDYQVFTLIPGPWEQQVAALHKDMTTEVEPYKVDHLRSCFPFLKFPDKVKQLDARHTLNDMPPDPQMGIAIDRALRLALTFSDRHPHTLCRFSYGKLDIEHTIQQHLRIRYNIEEVLNGQLEKLDDYHLRVPSLHGIWHVLRFVPGDWQEALKEAERKLDTQVDEPARRVAQRDYGVIC
jgi:hypothetical protein